MESKIKFLKAMNNIGIVVKLRKVTQGLQF